MHWTISHSFWGNFQTMLLDLLPPPSKGLVLLLDPETSALPCLDPAATADCSLYPLCFSSPPFPSQAVAADRRLH